MVFGPVVTNEDHHHSPFLRVWCGPPGEPEDTSRRPNGSVLDLARHPSSAIGASHRPGHDLCVRNRETIQASKCSPISGSPISLSTPATKPCQRHADQIPLGQMVTHPPTALNMAFGRRFDLLAGQPEPVTQRSPVDRPPARGGPPKTLGTGLGRHAAAHAATQRPPSIPASHPPAHPLIGDVKLQADDRHLPCVFEVRCIRPPPPPRRPDLRGGKAVGERGCHGPDATTDHRQQAATTPMAKPAAADRVNHRPGPHYLRPDPLTDYLRVPDAPGALPVPVRFYWRWSSAHQRHHPGPGGAVRHPPVHRRSDSPSPGPDPGARTSTQPRRPQRAANH